jgi:hypothetical protein
MAEGANMVHNVQGRPIWKRLTPAREKRVSQGHNAASTRVKTRGWRKWCWENTKKANVAECRVQFWSVWSLGINSRWGSEQRTHSWAPLT